MEGKRLFDRFGFDLPKNSKPQPKGARVVTDFYEWQFDPYSFDWLNTENELTLTGYAPGTELVKLLENRIDIEME